MGNANEPDDEQFAELLVDYEEVLSAGGAPSADDPRWVAASPQLREKVLDYQKCLQLLDEARREDSLHATRSDMELPTFEGPNGRLLPRELSRFQIRRELGRGGFGVVFLAHDPGMKRDVALKVPHPDVLFSAVLRKRFVREAHAAGALEHPNIVSIFEAGEAGNIWYIVSAYCGGPTLGEWLAARRDPVPYRLAAKIVLPLALAVEHAHEQGVFHRDLKPANVLLAPIRSSQAAQLATSANGSAEVGFTPKLTDFGLAKIVQAGANDDTFGASMAGTPRYMAPEQLAGRRNQIGPATDVYGLGGILYELLAGRPAFADSELSTYHQIQTEEPVPISRIRPTAPRALETIVSKCLAKDPARRYQTARDLAEDLRRFLTGEPILARPAGALERAGMWSRRHPIAAGLGALVAAVLCWLLLVGYWYHLQLAAALDGARMHVYSADMHLTQQAWERAELAEALALLERHVPAAGEKDQRGFEWHYLSSLCRGHAQVLAGHDRDVYALAYSPDGRRLASGGRDGSIVLWDPTTKMALRCLEGHGGEINALAFSKDGKLLASSSDDRTAKIWRAREGDCLATLSKHKGNVFGVDFSPDGSLIATGGAGGEIFLWNAATKEATPLPSKTNDDVEQLTFSPDGRWLAAARAKTGVHVWDVLRRSFFKSFADDSGATCVSFSPDGRQLAIVGKHSVIGIWDLQSGERDLRIGSDHADTIQSIMFHPDGRSVLTGSRDSTARRVCLKRRRCEQVYRGHTARIWCAVWAPNGQEFATGSEDGSVRIWPAHSERGHAELPTNGRSPRSISVDPTSPALAVGTDEGLIELWRLDRLDLPPAIFNDGRPIRSVEHSPDGQTLVSVGGDQFIHVWDFETASMLRRFPTRMETMTNVRFHPSGRYVVTHSNASPPKIWDVATGRELGTIGADPRGAECVCFTPDGHSLFTTTTEGHFQRWNWRAGFGETRQRRHKGNIADLRFTRDRAHLITVSEDRTARLWDSDTLSASHILIGHAHRINALAISPDDRTIFTGDDSGSIRGWHRGTGQEMISVAAPGSVRALAMSSDGSSLIALVGASPQRQEVHLWGYHYTSSNPSASPASEP